MFCFFNLFCGFTVWFPFFWIHQHQSSCHICITLRWLTTHLLVRAKVLQNCVALVFNEFVTCTYLKNKVWFWRFYGAYHSAFAFDSRVKLLYRGEKILWRVFSVYCCVESFVKLRLSSDWWPALLVWIQNYAEIVRKNFCYKYGFRTWWKLWKLYASKFRWWNM